MDWEKFISPEAKEEVKEEKRSHSSTLENIVKEISENNTLGNWVKSTNTKINYKPKYYY
jgi:hypothetical protein